MEGRKKGKLYRYSVCSRKPAWLLDLQWQVVCRYGEDEVEDTPGFWQELERYINFCIYEWHKNTDIKRSWKSHTNLTHPGKYFRPSKVKIMRPTSPK